MEPEVAQKLVFGLIALGAVIGGFILWKMPSPPSQEHEAEPLPEPEVQKQPTTTIKEKSMSDKTEVTINAKGMGDEILKGVHAAKSYVGPAWVTLLLYYIGFFFVGFIVNLVYLSKSNESMRITGSSPSGRGCLLFLLWTHLIIPIIAIIILVMGGGLASLNM